MYFRITSSLIGFSTSISFFLPSALASSSDVSAIGINLGTGYLTSVYITENDGFVKVASVEASQAWKDLSHHLPGRQDGKEIWRYKEATISEILLHILSSILEATDAKLIQEVKVLGITVPEFIAQYGYTKEMMKYANKVLSSLNDNVIPLPYYCGILKGYQLHEAEALGYPVGTDLDKEDTLVLQIDCEDSMLDVVSNDIGRKPPLWKAIFEALTMEDQHSREYYETSPI